jgi:hypothetical protein
VRLRLPRWDDHVAERLERAGISVSDAPHSFQNHPVEVTCTTAAASEDDARERLKSALWGWTVLLPYDFLAA